MNDTSSMGFAHFLGHADAVGKTLLLILVAMSAASWALIAIKSLTQALRGRRSARFLAQFWNAQSLAEVQRGLSAGGADSPYAHLAAEALHARAHHTRHGASSLADAGSEQEFLTRTIRKVLDEETMQLENGLTVLATVGSTATSWACSAPCGASITRCSPSARVARARSTRWPARSERR